MPTPIAWDLGCLEWDARIANRSKMCGSDDIIKGSMELYPRMPLKI